MSRLAEVKPISSTAYRNFVETCRSPATRKMYSKALKYFMSYLQLSPQDYDKLLDKDHKAIQMDICDFVTFMKKEHSSATMTLYLAAINKFYAMNDISTLNWKKIHSFEGEKEKRTEDRPYTHSEIQLLLQKTTPSNRAIILLMCSSGLRVGAFEKLRIRDLESIDKYGIYKVNVYATSKKSRYFSFCSVECRKEIDSYLEWRKRWGERLEPDAPLFRRDFNSLAERDRSKERVKSFQSDAIRWFIGRLLRDTGIRPVAPIIETESGSISKSRLPHPRSHIMQCHGFRKFFETNAFKAGMNNMYIRRLLGQKSGLEDSYLKISEEELLEGSDRHTGYVDIIDQLTINDEHRQRREVEVLKVEKSKVDNALSRINHLYEKFGFTYPSD
jgi:integrase